MGLKILIAEDEKDLLAQYRTILEDNHHTVITADDGEKGISLYEEELHKMPSVQDDEIQTPFDVVVLDYMMPKKKWTRCGQRNFGTMPKAKDYLCICIYSRNLI